MKHSNKILILASMIFAITACEKKVSLNDDKAKASYAIGFQVGNNFKQQQLDVDTAAVGEGIHDAVAVGKPQLTQEEMQKAINIMQTEMSKKQAATAEANKKTAQEFLDKNKSQPGVKVTKSGLQYIVEKEGNGKTPGPKDLVKCHYTGTLITGEKFDSSIDRGAPATFPVTGVIPGWTEALQLMKVGEKVKLFIPPELAYGPSARPGIPPNSVLVFELELLGIEQPPKAPAKKK